MSPLLSRGIARRPDEEGLFLALAPMDGITEAVYRELLTGLFDGHSGISLCVSEFVRVNRQAVPPFVFRRHCPELDRGGRTRAGVPVFVQLLGGDPYWMAEAAKVAASMGCPGIDLNFGCPAKTVNNSDGGATLLKDPARVESVTAAVRAAVPAEIPVTVKIRVGWSDASSIEAIARAAENGGGAWLTVHGRTRTQLYKPPVDWEAIGRARETISIPVIANGDIESPESLEACAKHSGCHAFMIGRGAMPFPDLFARLRGWQSEVIGLDALQRLWADYIQNLLAHYQNEKGALGRLKQWLRMAADSRPEIRPLFDRVKRQQSLRTALTALESHCTEASPAPQ